MVRSFSFIHLFVILAVGYIGGALLFREMPFVSVEKLLDFLMPGLSEGHEAGFIKTGGNDMLYFFVVAFGLSFVRKTSVY